MSSLCVYMTYIRIYKRTHIYTQTHISECIDFLHFIKLVYIYMLFSTLLHSLKILFRGFSIAVHIKWHFFMPCIPLCKRFIECFLLIDIFVLNVFLLPKKKPNGLTFTYIIAFLCGCTSGIISRSEIKGSV